MSTVLTPYTGCNIIITMTPKDSPGEVINEINYLKYDVQQQKQPVYGYNDKTYRTIMDGQKLVVGAFAINFIHPQYLLAQIVRESPTIDATSGSYLQIERTNNATKFQFLQDLRSRMLNGSTTKEIAKSIEDAGMRVGETEGDSSLTDILDVVPPFNIQISFTDMTGQIAGRSSNSSTGMTSNYQTAARAIYKATLTSFGQEFQPTGEPLQEVYTFIAPGMYNDLGGR